MKPGVRLAAYILLIALGVFGLGDVRAQNEPLGIVQLGPDEIQFSGSPTTPIALQTVVLAGDPTKAMLYTMRVKLPANFKVEPHWHAEDRMISVMSGTLHFGYGDTFDEAKMRALPAGSFFTEPAKQPHFAWAKSGDVIVQVSGIGPTGTTYLRSPSEPK